ncbi:hypothetical protein SNEBB_003113 [Seison nebaliae]|nr:hypothetical protein SNEBB_003113 [Seison nebaliae]
MNKNGDVDQDHTVYQKEKQWYESLHRSVIRLTGPIYKYEKYLYETIPSGQLATTTPLIQLQQVSGDNATNYLELLSPNKPPKTNSNCIISSEQWSKYNQRTFDIHLHGSVYEIFHDRFLSLTEDQVRHKEYGVLFPVQRAYVIAGNTIKFWCFSDNSDFIHLDSIPERIFHVKLFRSDELDGFLSTFVLDVSFEISTHLLFVSCYQNFYVFSCCYNKPKNFFTISNCPIYALNPLNWHDYQKSLVRSKGQLTAIEYNVSINENNNDEIIEEEQQDNEEFEVEDDVINDSTNYLYVQEIFIYHHRQHIATCSNLLSNLQQGISKEDEKCGNFYTNRYHPTQRHLWQVVADGNETVTKKRIFLLTNNNEIYELIIPKMSLLKRVFTGGQDVMKPMKLELKRLHCESLLSNMIPEFISSIFRNSSTSSINGDGDYNFMTYNQYKKISMISADFYRSVLYVLVDSQKLFCFDLGFDGNSFKLIEVFTIQKIMDQLKNISISGHIQLQKIRGIIGVEVLSPYESERFHFVLIFNTGVRIFYSFENFSMRFISYQDLQKVASSSTIPSSSITTTSTGIRLSEYQKVDKFLSSNQSMKEICLIENRPSPYNIKIEHVRLADNLISELLGKFERISVTNYVMKNGIFFFIIQFTNDDGSISSILVKYDMTSSCLRRNCYDTSELVDSFQEVSEHLYIMDHYLDKSIIKDISHFEKEDGGMSNLYDGNLLSFVKFLSNGIIIEITIRTLDRQLSSLIDLTKTNEFNTTEPLLHAITKASSIVSNMNENFGKYLNFHSHIDTALAIMRLVGQQSTSFFDAPNDGRLQLLRETFFRMVESFIQSKHNEMIQLEERQFNQMKSVAQTPNFMTKSRMYNVKSAMRHVTDQHISISHLGNEEKKNRDMQLCVELLKFYEMIIQLYIAEVFRPFWDLHLFEVTKVDSGSSNLFSFGKSVFNFMFSNNFSYDSTPINDEDSINMIQPYDTKKEIEEKFLIETTTTAEELHGIYSNLNKLYRFFTEQLCQKENNSKSITTRHWMYNWRDAFEEMDENFESHRYSMYPKRRFPQGRFHQYNAMLTPEASLMRQQQEIVESLLQRIEFVKEIIGLFHLIILNNLLDQIYGQLDENCRYRFQTYRFSSLFVKDNKITDKLYLDIIRHSIRYYLKMAQYDQPNEFSQRMPMKEFCENLSYISPGLFTAGAATLAELRKCLRKATYLRTRPEYLVCPILPTVVTHVPNGIAPSILAVEPKMMKNDGTKRIKTLNNFNWNRDNDVDSVRQQYLDCLNEVSQIIEESNVLETLEESMLKVVINEMIVAGGLIHAVFICIKAGKCCDGLELATLFEWNRIWQNNPFIDMNVIRRQLTDSSVNNDSPLYTTITNDSVEHGYSYYLVRKDFYQIAIEILHELRSSTSGGTSAPVTQFLNKNANFPANNFGMRRMKRSRPEIDEMSPDDDDDVFVEIFQKLDPPLKLSKSNVNDFITRIIRLLILSDPISSMLKNSVDITQERLRQTNDARLYLSTTNRLMEKPVVSFSLLQSTIFEYYIRKNEGQQLTEIIFNLSNNANDSAEMAYESWLYYMSRPLLENEVNENVQQLHGVQNQQSISEDYKFRIDCCDYLIQYYLKKNQLAKMINVIYLFATSKYPIEINTRINSLQRSINFSPVDQNKWNESERLNYDQLLPQIQKVMYPIRIQQRFVKAIDQRLELMKNEQTKLFLNEIVMEINGQTTDYENMLRETRKRLNESIVELEEMCSNYSASLCFYSVMISLLAVAGTKEKSLIINIWEKFLKFEFRVMFDSSLQSFHEQSFNQIRHKQQLELFGNRLAEKIRDACLHYRDNYSWLPTLYIPLYEIIRYLEELCIRRDLFNEVNYDQKTFMMRSWALEHILLPILVTDNDRTAIFSSNKLGESSPFDLRALFRVYGELYTNAMAERIEVIKNHTISDDFNDNIHLYYANNTVYLLEWAINSGLIANDKQCQFIIENIKVNLFKMRDTLETIISSNKNPNVRLFLDHLNSKLDNYQF